MLEEEKERSVMSHSGGLSEMTIPQFLCSFVYKTIPTDDFKALFIEIGITRSVQTYRSVIHPVVFDGQYNMIVALFMQACVFSAKQNSAFLRLFLK